MPRLEELTDQVEYDGFIYLGNVAEAFKVRGSKRLKLLHPSSILRKEYKLYDIREFAMKLDDFIRSLPCGKDH